MPLARSAASSWPERGPGRDEDGDVGAPGRTRWSAAGPDLPALHEDAVDRRRDLRRLGLPQHADPGLLGVGLLAQHRHGRSDQLGRGHGGQRLEVRLRQDPLVRREVGDEPAEDVVDPVDERRRRPEAAW